MLSPPVLFRAFSVFATASALVLLLIAPPKVAGAAMVAALFVWLGVNVLGGRR